MNRASLYLLPCVIFWGWTFVAAKICFQYVEPVEVLGLRYLFGLPVLLAIVLLKRLRFDFNAKERRSIILASAIITTHFLIQLTGVKYTSATNTGWLISVTPLVMALLAFLIHKERIGRRGITGIIIATGGIILLVSRGNLGSLDWLTSVGDWLVLISAHTWAVYTVVIRDVTRSKNPLAVTFAVLVPSGVLVLGFMLFTSDWSNFVGLPLEFNLAMFFLAIPGLAIAHWFWQEGVARLGAARAGIYLYLEPLATTALAVPLLGENFGLFTGLGGLLVLAGVYWAQQRK